MWARQTFSVIALYAARDSGEKEIVVIAREFDGYVGSNWENYEDQYGGYGYRVRNRQGKKWFFNFVQPWQNFEHDGREYTLQEEGKSASDLWVWLIRYCMVRRNQRKFQKDIEVLQSKEGISKHNLLVSEFKITQGK